MTNCMIKLLVLSIFLGWTAQNFAQEHSSETPGIELTGPAKVKPVDILDKILWGGGVLFNLSKKEGPIPLYSYEISELPVDTTLKALSLAAEGKVHMAILIFNDPHNKSIGQAWGLRVPHDWSSDSGEEWKKEEWENFKTELFAEKGNDVDIAFTRPLALNDTYSDANLKDKLKLARERNKFVTSMEPWSEAKNFSTLHP